MLLINKKSSIVSNVRNVMIFSSEIVVISDTFEMQTYHDTLVHTPKLVEIIIKVKGYDGLIPNLGSYVEDDTYRLIFC